MLKKQSVWPPTAYTSLERGVGSPDRISNTHTWLTLIHMIGSQCHQDPSPSALLTTWCRTVMITICREPSLVQTPHQWSTTPWTIPEIGPAMYWPPGTIPLVSWLNTTNRRGRNIFGSKNCTERHSHHSTTEKPHMLKSPVMSSGQLICGSCDTAYRARMPCRSALCLNIGTYSHGPTKWPKYGMNPAARLASVCARTTGLQSIHHASLYLLGASTDPQRTILRPCLP